MGDSLRTRVINAVGRLSMDEPSQDGHSVLDISDRMGVSTRRERKWVSTALSALCQEGKVTRVSRGMYKLVPRKKRRTHRDMMWSLVHNQRRVNLDDMQKLGVSREHARQALNAWVGAGYLRRVADTYIIQNDPGPETPAVKKENDRMKRYCMRMKVIAKELSQIAEELGS